MFQQTLPGRFLTSLNKGLTGHLLAGAVEAHDPAVSVGDNHQGSHRVEDRGHDVAFFLKLLLGILEVSDVERDSMDEPGISVTAADHFGFALKPDHPSVAGENPVGRLQGLPRLKHLGSFHTPTLPILRVDVLIPQHRIFQPFGLLEAEGLFYLRIDIGLTRSPIEIGHEYDSR